MKRRSNIVEEWRDVIGFEGFYQVSNLGRVKSLKQFNLCGRNKDGSFKSNITERIMSPVISEYGYHKIVLKSPNKVIKTSVHRVVAIAFIPNINNLPYVNHIDENKANNSLNNLEWCDHKYNCSYGNRSKKQALSMLNHPSISIPVIKLSKNGVEIQKYPSASEASRQNIVCSGNILKCCQGAYGFKTAGGYQWRFCYE